jgi:hypothetical protein
VLGGRHHLRGMIHSIGKLYCKADDIEVAGIGLVSRRKAV